MQYQYFKMKVDSLCPFDQNLKSQFNQRSKEIQRQRKSEHIYFKRSVWDERGLEVFWTRVLEWIGGCIRDEYK